MSTLNWEWERADYSWEPSLSFRVHFPGRWVDVGEIT